MTSLDLSEAYLHIPIQEAHQRFLRFALPWGHYQFRALPFGLATAPRTFTKIMVAAALRKEGILVHPYLDDWLIQAKSAEESLRVTGRVVQFLQELGWVVNPTKSRLQPTQELEYLGVRFNTRRGQVFLPRKRAEGLWTLVRQFRSMPAPSAWDYLWVLGTMAATLEAVPWVRFHMRPLQRALLRRWFHQTDSLSTRLPCPGKVRQSLRWWLCRLSLTSGLPMEQPEWLPLLMDASLGGWGAHCGSHFAQGLWSPLEASWAINRLELRAVFRALQAFQDLVRGRPVQVLSDNSATVAYIN